MFFPKRIILESRTIRNSHDPLCVDYSLFNTCKESIFSSLLPYYSYQVGSILSLYFKNIKDIIDATAHIGCDSINFRNRFKANCISIESDYQTYLCLKKNHDEFISLYKDKTDSHVVNGNFLDFVDGFKKRMDFVYIDPPWGGIKYADEKDLMLYLYKDDIKYPLYDVVNFVFKQGFTKHIVIKVPFNFNKKLFEIMLDGIVLVNYHKVFKKKRNKLSFIILICEKSH